MSEPRSESTDGLSYAAFAAAQPTFALGLAQAFHQSLPSADALIVSALAESVPGGAPVHVLAAGAAPLAGVIAKAAQKWIVTGSEDIGIFAEEARSTARTEDWAFLPGKPVDAARAHPRAAAGVVQFGRLQHLDDWSEVVESALALVRPGGRIVIGGAFNEFNYDVRAKAHGIGKSPSEEEPSLPLSLFAMDHIRHSLKERVRALEFRELRPVGIAHREYLLGLSVETDEKNRNYMFLAGFYLPWHLLVVDAR